MAVNDVYRLSVDYTLAQQVTSAISGKTAFVPYVQFYAGGTAFDVNITGPLGAQAIAASVAVNPATSSTWSVVGSVASGATDSGNPIKGGYLAKSAAPTPVSDGQRVNAIGDIYGNGCFTPRMHFGTITGLAVGSTGIALARTDPTITVMPAVGNFVVSAASTWVYSNTVVAANNTQGTGTQAVGMPLWSTTDTTQLRINVATSGDTALVAAVSGQTTRVYALRLSVAGAVIVTIKTGSTVQEVFNFAGNGGAVVFDLRDRPYYKTAANEALNINLSANIQVDGRLEYVTSA